MAAEEPWSLVIGRVMSTHGYQGEVKVEPLTDFPQRFQDLDQVCLQFPQGRESVLAVESARMAGSRVILKFKQYQSRESAAELRGALLKVKRSMAVDLPEGHYFFHQIIGLLVVTTTGENLGEITEVLRTGANDVYVTDRVLIPATKEVVRDIDLEAGVMTIEPLEGLIESR